MSEKPPWLFIYFQHLIKIIQPMRSEADPSAGSGSNDPSAESGFRFLPRDELWITGIGPKHMVQYAIAKTHVDMWDRHYIALKPGCAWTAIICSPPGSLAFRPWTAPVESELLIPVDLINRIYDMANRRLIHTLNMCKGG